MFPVFLMVVITFMILLGIFLSAYNNKTKYWEGFAAASAVILGIILGQYISGVIQWK